MVFGFQSKVDVELFAQLETNICERKNLLNQKSNTFAHTGQVELMILSYKRMQEMSKDFRKVDSECNKHLQKQCEILVTGSCVFFYEEFY